MNQYFAAKSQVKRVDFDKTESFFRYLRLPAHQICKEKPARACIVNGQQLVPKYF